MKLILLFILTSIQYSQVIVLTATSQLEKRSNESKAQTFDRSKTNLRADLNTQLQLKLDESFGIKLDDSEIRQCAAGSKEISFLVLRSEWVSQRLFITAEYKFNLIQLIRELDQLFLDQVKMSSYEEQNLKFTLDRIRKNRDALEKQRSSNTDIVLSLIKIGMHRVDVLKLFLMLTERKLALDLSSVKIKDTKTEYFVKNTYLRIQFDENGYVKNFVDDRASAQR